MLDQVMEFLGLKDREFLEHQVELSLQAERLLEDQLLNKFFSDTEKDLFDLWCHSNPDDAEGREKAYLMLQMCKKFKDYLELYVMDGKMARESLETLKDGK